jgi:ABC-2 type transport system permease protein
MPVWVKAIAGISPLTYEVEALRGLLIGTPTNLALDFGVLLVALLAGITAAAALLGRLERG